MAKKGQVAAGHYDDLANELQAWRRKREIGPDTYLDGLLAALVSQKGLEDYIDLPVVEWLPRPRSQKARVFGDIGRLIAIVRNVLIFLPVAITWFAIGKATQAFQAYVAAGGNEVANFLDFWQNGYGVLANEWRISNIAVLDFRIILTLIGLSFISGVLQARAIRISSRDNALFEAERQHLAISLEHLFRKLRKPTALTVSSDLAIAVSRLANAALAIQMSSQRLEEVAGDIAVTQQKGMNVTKKMKDLDKLIAQIITPTTKRTGRELVKLHKTIEATQKALGTVKKRGRKAA